MDAVGHHRADAGGFRAHGPSHSGPPSRSGDDHIEVHQVSPVSFGGAGGAALVRSRQQEARGPYPRLILL